MIPTRADPKFPIGKDGVGNNLVSARGNEIKSIIYADFNSI